MQAIQKVDSKGTLLSLCLIMVVSLGTLQIQPMLGGAFVDQLGLSLNEIGPVFASELIAMAFACGASAMLMPRINRQCYALMAIVLMIISNIASCYANRFVELVVLRLCAGLGGGAAMAVVYASAALRSSKDATFAVINIGNLIWGVLLVSSMPLVLGHGGVASCFLLLGVASVIAAFGIRRIPARFAGAVAGNQQQVARIGLTSILLISLFALLFFGHSALWVYQERIGKSIGLAPEQIGAILGASVLAGAVGAGLAGLIKRRLGLLFPQLFGFGTALIATLMMVYGTSALSFALTAGLIHLVWFFCLPYLLSMAAELDPSGRLAGLGNAAIFVGQGLGPFAAALVVGTGDFRAVGWLAAGAYVVALITAVTMVASFNRGQRYLPARVLEVDCA
ncbi:Predicted arabinose efflux permease, MFS family [Pseudomonas asplenii]|uniref:Predicted arabinose efflux permease, MFS family n=1 Tax=Pseudomonas asplenii TaxID=53407 RepID=A0A1H1Y933_9PSED|nr:MFS transporter [Pseudomonas asplenii]SDT17970.1 Predicted arabinose efflux permease, MFS family [Pseudomonas asplenii]